jgi:hypothetical protein
MKKERIAHGFFYLNLRKFNENLDNHMREEKLANLHRWIAGMRQRHPTDPRLSLLDPLEQKIELIKNHVANARGEVARVEERLLDDLLKQLAFTVIIQPLTQKHDNLRHGGRATEARDKEMAREHQRRLPASQMSFTALAIDIGARQDPPIRRSASIEAVQRGYKKLSGNS